MESLHLYEPLPYVKEFHKSPKSTRLLRGSNRSGKTLSNVCEIARALTGQDPYDKYPKKNGRCYLVAFDGKQIGQTIFRKLCMPGAFSIIEDKDTGEWRVFKPWLDWEFRHRRKPAPPLIEERYIKGGWNGIAWMDKKANIPHFFKLHNGWEVTFFSSQAKPPKGVDLDLVGLDEEIENELWIPEMYARLVDRGGKLIWSVTPEVGSEHLYEMHRRFEEGEEDIDEFLCLISDNHFLTEDVKRKFLADLTSEEDRRVKFYGEYARESRKVYPEFQKHLHTTGPEHPAENPLVRESWFKIPDEWTNYLVVDSGRQVAAVLFATVPDPQHELAGHIILFDELYIKKCTAELLGIELEKKVQGKEFYAFIIDRRGSRVNEVASGRNIEQQYCEQFKKRKIICTTTGSSFTWGSDEKKAGISAFRSWLIPLDDGIPKVMLMGDKMANLRWEIEKYQYKKIRTAGGEMISDDPVDKDDHLLDCSRMLAMYNPKWHKPTGRKTGHGAVYRSFQKLKKKIQQIEGMTRYISLGPKG